MSIENVQLKQEDVLDGNVVLTDINPITDTESINDSVSGEKLNETILRIWNAINNKLTRIVNSVNGRTGVVVLSAEDVGLGNVDNISFAEIKEWIRELMESEFKNRALKLYNSLADVDAIIATNDRSYTGAPFFCDIISVSDRRSCIGYYDWDTSNNHLYYMYKPINTIGFTDFSIIYNDEVNGVDLRGGGIGVNIHRDERALKLVTSSSISESGLRIDQSVLAGRSYFIDGLYGTPSIWPSTQPSPPIPGTMLLSCQQSSDSDHTVAIYINDTQVFADADEPPKEFYLDKDTTFDLRVGDTIITNFGWYGYLDPSGALAPIIFYDASTNVMFRQPAIGYVSSAPSDLHPDAPYEIRFTSIKPLVDFGLKYHSTHYKSSTLKDSAMTISLDTYNRSGLNAAVNAGSPNFSNPNYTEYYAEQISVQQPWAPTTVSTGLMITSDSTISTSNANDIVPSGKKYIDESGNVRYCGSYKSYNYAYDPRGLYDTNLRTPNTTNAIEIGILAGDSRCAVNLNKCVRMHSVSNNTFYELYNLSGLRAAPWGGEISPSEMRNEHITSAFESIGILDGKDAVGNVIEDFVYTDQSGGLQINVGKFLEICPVQTEHAVEYNNGGKLQVRIGNGLKEDATFEQVLAEPDDWYQNINNYYLIEEDDTELIPVPMSNQLTLEEPENWLELYQSYGIIDGDVFVPNPPSNEKQYLQTSSLYESAPSFYTETYYKQSGVYPDYTYDVILVKPYDWDVSYVDTFVVRDIPPTWESDTYFFHRHMPYNEATMMGYTVWRKVSTNRITINTDPTTLDFNENGQLTVIGGVGGNVGISDYRGCCFNPTPDNQNVKFINLGQGLKITGVDPPKEIAFGKESLREYLLEVVTDCPAIDLWNYAKTVNSATSISLGGLSGLVSQLTTTIQNASTWNQLNTIQNIFTTVYGMSDVSITKENLYLTNSYQIIYNRIIDILTSIEEKDNATSMFQSIIDHYGMTCAPTKAGISSVIMSTTFIDESYDYPFIFDWFFELGFAEV